jgi:hypothetical protein
MQLKQEQIPQKQQPETSEMNMLVVRRIKIDHEKPRYGA